MQTALSAALSTKLSAILWVSCLLLPWNTGAALANEPGVNSSSLKSNFISAKAQIIEFEDKRQADPKLFAFLESGDQKIRESAIVALGRIGDSLALEKLLAILESRAGGENTKELAVFALGEIESARAAPILLNLVKDPASSTILKARAAEALGKICSNSEAGKELGADAVKNTSLAIIEIVPPPDSKLDPDGKLLTRLALTALLRIKDPSAVQAFLKQLEAVEGDSRWQAAYMLARFKDGISLALPALKKLLSDKEALVRAHAARALGALKSDEAVAELIVLLKDNDKKVQANSISALGSIASKDACEPLIELGEILLAEYKKADFTKIVPEEQNLLLLIAEALGSIKDERALDFLQDLRNAKAASGGKAPEIEIAVAKFGEPAFFGEQAEFEPQKQSWQSTAAYAQGFGEIKSPKSKECLLAMLEVKPDPRAVTDILNALSKQDADGFEKILLKELNSEDPVVRATAASLLAEKGSASELAIESLKQAMGKAKKDKMNDARLAILEAADKLKHPLNLEALQGKTRDPDYIVRRRALELLLPGGDKYKLANLNAGSPECNPHNKKDYWRKMAELSQKPEPPLAIIKTKKGEVKIELFNKEATLTVDNFTELANSGYFDGLSFMRVAPNFVIQGGDPRNDMNGGPGYQIRCEINRRPYLRGSLGMALSGKDTGASQFFITHSPQPHLDGGYTVFGQVLSGMDAVDAIARGELIESIRVINDQSKH